MLWLCTAKSCKNCKDRQGPTASCPYIRLIMYTLSQESAGEWGSVDLDRGQRRMGRGGGQRLEIEVDS